jgi:adenosylcobinamide-GDP ribazoletransferase
MRSFLIALQFLTIIPVRVSGDLTSEQMRRSVLAFPAVGFVIGVLLVISDRAFSLVFSSPLTSAFVLVVLVIVTGALHQDGLADTFDALAVRGDVARKLAVMRDPTAGPVGIVAIIITLGLRFLTIEEIASLSSYAHYAGLLFMPVLGRWGQVTGMFLGKPSRPDGLGKIFIGKISGGLYAGVTLVAVILFAAASLAAGGIAPKMWYVFGAVGFVLVFVLTLLLVRHFKKHFGGENGDTLGGGSEFTEILFLCWVIVWSRLFI